MNNIKSIGGIIFIVGGLIFGYGTFRANSQNVKEKVGKNTCDIAALKESVNALLLMVKLQAKDKEYLLAKPQTR